MPSRSAGVSLAVPISMPWYSCIESALTTSPSSARASASERSDLPAAVGPTTAMTGRSMASVWQRRVSDRTRDAAGGGRRSGGSMSYGDDIIMSDGFVPDEEDEEFDSAAYERQFRED